MWQIWLIIAGACLIIEMLTVGFLVFWFAMGALIAMAVSFFIDNVVIQTTIFIITSTILLFATKPFVEKFQKSTPNYKTNSASIEGEKGIVTSDINEASGSGKVKVHTEVWSAKSFDGNDIPSGTEVTVEKIEGVKAIVKPIK